MLILDCTYKTNAYEMPFLDIVGISTTGTTFFAGLCFMDAEEIEDYVWALVRLKLLYQRLRIAYPGVLVTDREPAVAAAIQEVFPEPETVQMVCQWHVNKNIVEKCKKKDAFDDENAWKAFFNEWFPIINAKSEAEYHQAIEHMQIAYGSSHPAQVTYLEGILQDHSHQLVAYKVDVVLHLGMKVTSRGEMSHGKLKRNLRVSNGDVKTVVDKITLMLKAQVHEQQVAIEREKIYKPIEINKHVMFREVLGKVSVYALKKVLVQWKELIKAEGPLNACTGVYTTTLGLPCKHLLQHYRFRHEALSTADFHRHWHLYRDQPDVVHPPINPLLLVEPPRLKQRRQYAARTRIAPKHSTQRGLSNFEHVEAEFDMVIRPNPSFADAPTTPTSPFKGPRGRALAGHKGAETRKRNMAAKAAEQTAIMAAKDLEIAALRALTVTGPSPASGSADRREVLNF